MLPFFLSSRGPSLRCHCETPPYTVIARPLPTLSLRGPSLHCHCEAPPLYVVIARERSDRSNLHEWPLDVDCTTPRADCFTPAHWSSAYPDVSGRNDKLGGRPALLPIHRDAMTQRRMNQKVRLTPAAGNIGNWYTFSSVMRST